MFPWRSFFPYCVLIRQVSVMEFNSSNDKVLHTYIVCSILNEYFPSFLKYAFGLPRGMLSWLLHKSLILIASNVKQRKHFNRLSATLSNFLDLAQSQILAPKSTNLKPILTRNPKTRKPKVTSTRKIERNGNEASKCEAAFLVSLSGGKYSFLDG